MILQQVDGSNAVSGYSVHGVPAVQEGSTKYGLRPDVLMNSDYISILYQRRHGSPAVFCYWQELVKMETLVNPEKVWSLSNERCQTHEILEIPKIFQFDYESTCIDFTYGMDMASDYKVHHRLVCS